MMNSKSLFIFVILFGIIIATLISRNGEIAILTIPFIVYLCVGLLKFPTSTNLRATRTLGKNSITVMEKGRIALEIINEGESLGNVHVVDTVLPGAKIIDGRSENWLYLPKTSRFKFSYDFLAKRGIFTWDTLQVIVSDPLCLFEISHFIPAEGKISISPTITKIRRLPIHPHSTLHSTGSIRAGIAGSGTDFWGVREYQIGDKLQRLNWRLTARHPHRLFTKEFEQEEVADVVLVLDARALSDNQSTEESLFEYSVQATTALADYFIKGGNRVGLLVYSKVIKNIFPGYGRRQLSNILTVLSQVNPQPYIPLNILKNLPGRIFPKNAQLFVVSPLGPDDEDAYFRLRSFGYQIYLLSPDPLGLCTLEKRNEPSQKLALRAAHLDRYLKLQRLLMIGVRVIDWQMNKSLNETLYRYFNNTNRNKNILENLI